MPWTVKVRVRESALVGKTHWQFSRWITAFGRNQFRRLASDSLLPGQTHTGRGVTSAPLEVGGPGAARWHSGPLCAGTIPSAAV